jgi:hypothetical protein
VIFKWALVLFGALAIGLLVLSKLLAFLQPPRPGRPPSLALRRVERALRWSVLIPAALAVLLLVLAMLSSP